MRSIILCLFISFRLFGQNQVIGTNTAGTANEWKSLSATPPLTITNGAGSITFSLATRDMAAFSGTNTRLAIYLPGCRQSWQFGYAIRKNGLPIAGDVLSYWCKTDSLLWFRSAGTTSGEMFSYWREK